jgi:hypothetical protein
MRKFPFYGTTLLAALLLFVTSCKKDNIEDTKTTVSATHADHNHDAPDEVSSTEADADLLKKVQQATARFQSSEQAIKAGYVPDNHCVSVPGLGGMGYHWVKPSLVDGIFDPLQPEALLYAPGPGGKVRLVGVEYLVVNQGQERPSFGSKKMDINGSPMPFPHWALHVWAYEHNPSGLFAPFNPNVSCQ